MEYIERDLHALMYFEFFLAFFISEWDGGAKVSSLRSYLKRCTIPVLPGSSNSTQQRQLEARAKRLRDQAARDAAAEGDGKVKKRETWMLEMPEEKAQSFGLGPRSGN